MTRDQFDGIAAWLLIAIGGAFLAVVLVGVARSIGHHQWVGTTSGIAFAAFLGLAVYRGVGQLQRLTQRPTHT